MNTWRDQSVLSTQGWTPELLQPLFDLARTYKQAIARKEDVRISHQVSCLTLFYEPSTRTRLSFESAAHRLGIRVLSVANAGHDSSAFKGETLEDTGRILSAYTDLLIMRHPEVGSVKRLSEHSKIPVINAGDGAGEHPTQALLDLFSIQEVFGNLRGLHVGLCGDLKYGRTVHSLLRLLLQFGCRVTAIAPRELAFPDFETQQSLQEVIPSLDVLYMTRVQKERFPDLSLYEAVKPNCSLLYSDLKRAKPTLKILHPLPRVDELDPAIDQDSRAYYFQQAANGVPVRMAILSKVLL